MRSMLNEYLMCLYVCICMFTWICVVCCTWGFVLLITHDQHALSNCESTHAHKCWRAISTRTRITSSVPSVSNVKAGRLKFCRSSSIDTPAGTQRSRSDRSSWWESGLFCQEFCEKPLKATAFHLNSVVEANYQFALQGKLGTSSHSNQVDFQWHRNLGLKVLLLFVFCKIPLNLTDTPNISTCAPTSVSELWIFCTELNKTTQTRYLECNIHSEIQSPATVN